MIARDLSLTDSNLTGILPLETLILQNEIKPVEIHIYGLRYKPGMVLVFERGGLVCETYTAAGSGQKRETALTVQDFLETLAIASCIIRHIAPPPRQADPA